MRRRADHDCVGLREALKSRGDVGRLTEGELLAAATTADLAHDDPACVNADMNRQRETTFALEARIQPLHRGEDPQACTHGALGRVLMRDGISEVQQKSVAEML